VAWCGAWVAGDAGEATVGAGGGVSTHASAVDDGELARGADVVLVCVGAGRRGRGADWYRWSGTGSSSSCWGVVVGDGDVVEELGEVRNGNVDSSKVTWRDVMTRLVARS
jgi:hypothetical protein